MNTLEKITKYEPQSLHHEIPVVWDIAEDWWVWGTYKDKWCKFIDFTSGILVANIGHKRSAVVSAIHRQPVIHSYVFPNEMRANLVEKLCELSGMKKVLLTVTGSEANDAVIQMMQRRKPNTRILSIKGAYYGSTIGCRGLIDEIDEDITPETFNPDEIGGIFLQAFRGWNSKFLPFKWINTWVEWGQSNGIPVGFDEMQSGFGRTGKMFGYEHYGVKPNFICVGKALGGGLPISAVIGDAELLELSDDLWSTHTGNPICCAAALETINILCTEKLVEKAARDGKWIEWDFKNFKYKVKGKGMVWAIDLEDVDRANKVVEMCADKGLLLITTNRGTIKIAPPLITPREYIKKGLDIIKEVIDKDGCDERI